MRSSIYYTAAYVTETSGTYAAPPMTRHNKTHTHTHKRTPKRTGK